jgi:sugar transferase (PEP-CTERM/EpsH1 system associated)
MEFGVVKLVNGVDRARITSSILSTRPATDLKRLLSPDVRLYELSRRPGNDPRLVWHLYRVFRAARPDIVHTHAWGTLIEGLLAARLARVRTVVHGEHGTLQLRPYQRWLQRRSWAAVDKVLSVSSRLAERMSSETGFPLGRIATIRNGVDLTRFGRTSRTDARAALGLASDGLVIGTMGRLVPVKDHASLIKATRRLRDEGLSLTVLIAGEGPLRGELEAATVSSGLNDTIKFLGHRADPDVVVAALDVYVLSSVSEGLPNTLLEAMATGVPAVVTRVGGVDEVVEDGTTGFLVPPSDPVALAQALAVLLRDEASRRKMGSDARARAESEFALAGMLRRYERLYASVARDSAGRTRAWADGAVRTP